MCGHRPPGHRHEERLLVSNDVKPEEPSILAAPDDLASAKIGSEPGVAAPVFSRGRKFLILDGGMNHHLAASGSIYPTIKKNHPIAVITKLQTKAHEHVDIVGPFCSHLDSVGRNIDLAEGEIGDLVGIFQSGAYARSVSRLGFLSHDSPAEVLVDCGQDFLIRSRGTTEDFMRDVSIPSHLAGKAAGTSLA